MDRIRLAQKMDQWRANIEHGKENLRAILFSEFRPWLNSCRLLNKVLVIVGYLFTYYWKKITFSTHIRNSEFFNPDINSSPHGYSTWN